MKLFEAWRLSRTPYVELTYRSSVMTRGTARGGFGRARSPAAQVKSALRGALLSKGLFAVFISVATLYAYAQYITNPSPEALVAGVSFSLALSLAYVVLYSLQVLPSFSGGEPYALLSTLPLDTGDLSLVSVLSVVRVFDWIIAASVAAQVAVVAYATSSAPAAAVMLLVSVANTVFGVAISLWLSGVFYWNMTRGGRGKGAAIARFVFLVSWGLAAVSIGFLFNVVSYAEPLLNSVLAGGLADYGAPFLFALVHPFSEALVIVSLVYPAFGIATSSLGGASALSFVMLAVYSLLAYLAAKRSLSTVTSVLRGPLFLAARRRATDFLLKLRHPIAAYILKDFRIASKNPATAFIFGFPVFEVLIVGLSLSGFSTVRATSVLSSTTVGCFFTLIVAAALLNTEASALEYTLSLPLGARIIVLAKSAIATVAYLPVPAAIAVFLILSRTQSPLLFLVPLLEIAAVSAATSTELSFFIHSYRAGGGATSGGIETRGMSLMSGSSLLRLIGALVVSGMLALAPLLAYGGVYLLTFSHEAAVGAMAALATGEFGAVQLYLRRS